MWRSIPRVFELACHHHRDRVAVIDGDRQVTYQELHAQAAGVARGLRGLNADRGTRVGILAPNGVEFISAMYGIWMARDTLVQLPAMAHQNDVAQMLATAEAETLIYHENFDDTIDFFRRSCPTLTHFVRIASSEDLSPQGVTDFAEFVTRGTASGQVLEESEPDDLAFVAYTSGATGQPKAVRQTQASYAHYAITAGMELGDIRPGERFVHGAPLTHFTQQFLLPTFMRGGTNITIPSMNLAALSGAVREHRATATAVVPTLIYLLLDDPDIDTQSLASLQTIVYGGSPMSPERLRQAIDTFGPVFVQGYGGTEPGFMTCFRKEEHVEALEQHPERIASAGRAFYHAEVSIRDSDGRPVAPGEVGEIWCRQEGQMVGYLDSSLDAETMHDDWIRSGDMGRMDEDGYLFVVDRVKDMIVTGGFNVFPRQIEDVLLTHPAVAQCAVIGVPDAKWGEAVKAIVVLRAGAQATAEELIASVKSAKGSVWAPKSVDFVETLPLNPAGKVNKKVLREPFWAQESRQIG